MKSKQGNFATLTALTAPIFIGIAAIAVDTGALFVERRHMQSMADIAAISGAANIGQASQAVMAHLRDNHADAVLMSGPYDPEAVRGKNDNITRVWLDKGVYKPDQTIVVGQRFVSSAVNPNALRVTLARPGRLYFGQSFIDRPAISASGLASSTAEAAFSVGSRLASLEGGAINGLLGSLIGTTLNLKAGDYQALLDTDINLLSFLDALASEVKLTAGTYDDLLKTDASVGQIANAFAKVSTQNPKALVGLGVFGSDPAMLKTKLPIGKLLDLGPLAKLGIEGGAGYDIKANVMQMLSAAVMLGGKHQVGLGADLPLDGLAKVSVQLAIGEPAQSTPFFAVGDAGTLVRTAQVRLKLALEVFNNGLVSQIVGLKLPIYVDVASAEAELKSISCPTGRRESAIVTLGVKPGLAGVYIGDMTTDFYSFNQSPRVVEAEIAKVRLLILSLVEIMARAEVKLGNDRQQLKSFNWNDIQTLRTQTVSTNNLTQSLVGSLFNGLTLRPKVLGLSLPIDLRGSIVGTLLTPIVKPLDDVLFSLLKLLGVSIGEADVQVNGVNCERTVLVQ